MPECREFGFKLHFSPGCPLKQTAGPTPETVDLAREGRRKALPRAAGADSLARTLNNVPLNPLLIGLSRDNEGMISGHVLRALQRRGAVGFQRPPPHGPLPSALKSAHQCAGRPSASRPFVVPKLVKLKQSDV